MSSELAPTVDAHDPDVGVCGECNQLSTDLATVCTGGGGLRHCSQYCEDCRNTTELTCHSCGPVCGRHEEVKDFLYYADAGTSLWVCHGCIGDQTEAATVLAGRLARLEEVGIPALRLVTALLDVLEGMPLPKGGKGPT
jgi:hypothetical protein